jgi:Pro-kumamolisin, activation domain
MRRAVTAGVLVVLVLGMLLAGALVSGASGTTEARMVRMRGGVPPRPARMRILKPLAGTTGIPLTITLQPRDPAALEHYATAVSTPGSGDFRHFLSVVAFRARFAPTDAQITAVCSALGADGLKPSRVTANGLVIAASGSASRLSRTFSTSFDRVKLANERRAYINTSAPSLPSSIASTSRASPVWTRSTSSTRSVWACGQRSVLIARQPSDQTWSPAVGSSGAASGRARDDPEAEDRRPHDRDDHVRGSPLRR